MQNNSKAKKLAIKKTTVTVFNQFGHSDVKIPTSNDPLCPTKPTIGTSIFIGD
jgi:hypothetical protein